MLPNERFARVWLSALIVIFGAYFSTLALVRPDASSIALRIGLLAAALGVLGLVAGGTWLAQRWRRRPDDAEDERDRAIEHKASAVAYRVLMVGMILVGCVMPFDKQGMDIVNAAVFAIALAEVVRHGLIVVGYRRGLRA
ncbi:DUF2178 domain-containing protein [Luteibacter sp. PPL552]|jgi:uncharacterized membrane protein